MQKAASVCVSFGLPHLCKRLVLFAFRHMQLKIAGVTSESEGQVTLYVPDLRPERKYHLRVLPSVDVRDGFNLPLQVMR